MTTHFLSQENKASFVGFRRVACSDSSVVIYVYPKYIENQKNSNALLDAAGLRRFPSSDAKHLYDTDLVFRHAFYDASPPDTSAHFILYATLGTPNNLNPNPYPPRRR